MTARILKTVSKSLLIATLLMCGVAHADSAIQVVNEYGRPVAQFKVGDSHCVLKDDQIRCTPVNR
jgi:hypothetical protein